MTRRLTLEESVARFWCRVDKVSANPCWLWKGARRHRYGEVWRDGKRHYAHRVAWRLVHGPIPAGMNVLHSCDAPLCVRPAHLRLGTQTENSQDMMKRGRGRGQFGPGECHHASLTPEDVRVIHSLRSTGMTYVALAEEFGVSPSAIGTLCRRRSWSRVS